MLPRDISPDTSFSSIAHHMNVVFEPVCANDNFNLRLCTSHQNLSYALGSYTFSGLNNLQFFGKVRTHIGNHSYPANGWQQNTSFDGKILIAAHTDSYLLSYDNETFTRFTYPTVDGVQMTFTKSRNPLVNFEGTVFFGLEPFREIAYHPLGIQYLYKFNGHHFSRIAIPGQLRSNCVVYGGYLFFLSKVSTTTRLYRYSAGIVTEVVGANILNDDGYNLRVIEGHLYITGHPGYEGYYSFIRRYDGANFLTIFEDYYGHETTDIFPIPGTNRLYFTTQNKIVYYHNGITASSVFSGVTDRSLNARIWRNELYFTQPTDLRDGIIVPPNIYKVSGATLTSVNLPPGYQFTNSPNIEVHNSSLILDANFSDGSSRLLRYDGISFNFLFNFPRSGTPRAISLLLRENDLIIQGGRPTHTYIYNGSVFDEIIFPTGYHLSYTSSPFVSSTRCNFLWQLYTSDRSVPSHERWIYAKESKNCPPPPPPTPPRGPVAVIPDDFMIHERFEALAIGSDRGWCWNEIIFGWDTIPICPAPPCPEPNYQLTMIDVNNKSHGLNRLASRQSSRYL